MTHPDVGMQTRGRLTVFEAFFVLRDGNPFKRNQPAKIRNPSGQDSRGSESPRPLAGEGLAPALFMLARSHCVSSPRLLVDGETSREPGHWPAPKHCGSGATTSQKRKNRRETSVTRHRSAKCATAHFGDHTILMGQLLVSTLGKTRDSLCPIRSLPHLPGIVTRCR